MVFKQLIFLTSVFILTSCFNNEKGRVIASANEKELLLSQVLKEMPNQIEDSIFFVEKYMNDWIRKQLMIYHAEINLSSDIRIMRSKLKITELHF